MKVHSCGNHLCYIFCFVLMFVNYEQLLLFVVVTYTYRYDLWNDGFVLDEPASSTCITVASDSSSCECHSTTIIVGIVVPLVVIIIALVAYIIWAATKRAGPMAAASDSINKA